MAYLNSKLNCRPAHPFPDELSRHRYAQFQGYHNLVPEKLPFQRSLAQPPSFIPLGRADTFTQSSAEAGWLRTTQEYNSKLNQDPHNVRLWVEFANIQEALWPVSQGRETTAIAERQLSILGKGLQLNPLNEQLGLAYLEKLLEREWDRSLLLQKCRELVEAHPHSSRLWGLYLQLRIG
jgi:hypothetical protein